MIPRWNLHKPRPHPTTQIFFEDFALRDRFSVIRFVGFSVMSDTPDYSTISRFRSRLLGLKIYDKLFDEINRQLVKKGFIVRERSAAVVERVVIESANRPKKYIKNIPEDREEEYDENEVENNKKSCSKETFSGGSHFEIEYSKDPYAMWLKKGKRSYFGYKGFVGADLGGFIINGLMTPANKSEMRKFSDILDKLCLPIGTPVLADKGYCSRDNRKLLTGLGLKDFIMHKSARGKKLTEYQKKMNKSISKVRYIVEQVFGILKRHYNFTRCGYPRIKESQYGASVSEHGLQLKESSWDGDIKNSTMRIYCRNRRNRSRGG